MDCPCCAPPEEHEYPWLGALFNPVFIVWLAAFCWAWLTIPPAPPVERPETCLLLYPVGEFYRVEVAACP